MKQFRNNQLVIQKSCTKTAFLGGGIPTIGIHGIAGSFTDEALHRFTTEHLGLSTEQYIVKELVEASHVLKEVAAHRVALGLFAFANS